MPKTDEFRERVAALCHKQWSEWMEYLFSKSYRNDAGTVIVPSQSAIRWTRQTETDYADLSEEEKDSNRAEADRFIALFEGELEAIAEDEGRLDGLLSDTLDDLIACDTTNG